MTETITSELTHLDFTAALPCENSGHNVGAGTGGLIGHRGEAAVWVNRSICPACGIPFTQLVCEARRLLWLNGPKQVACIPGCGKTTPKAEWLATFTPIPEAGDAS